MADDLHDVVRAIEKLNYTTEKLLRVQEDIKADLSSMERNIMRGFEALAKRLDRLRR